MIQEIKHTRRGFTLMELLIVVLIIGILAAIALPQYQKTVLKSRYSALMPLAKAVSDAEELYYMEHGNYSTDITNLDITTPFSGVNTTLNVSHGEDERFSYVLANRTDVPGVAYVIYQKHSEQFPGVVMCEANDALTSQATWLCHDSLKGKFVESGSLQGADWKAYLLAGVEGESTFSKCLGSKPTSITANKSGAIGTPVCNEQSGEYEYSWSTGNTYSDGDTYSPSQMYDYAGATFDNYTECFAWNVERGCSSAHYSNGSECDGRSSYGCADSVFTSKAYCYPNGNAENFCAGSTFADGGYCWGDDDSGSGCVNAIISDGGYCMGHGCDNAIYPESGTGCCRSGCASGSGIRKCPNGTWDGESYW